MLQEVQCVDRAQCQVSDEAGTGFKSHTIARRLLRALQWQQHRLAREWIENNLPRLGVIWMCFTDDNSRSCATNIGTYMRVRSAGFAGSYVSKSAE